MSNYPGMPLITFCVTSACNLGILTNHLHTKTQSLIDTKDKEISGLREELKKCAQAGQDALKAPTESLSQQVSHLCGQALDVYELMHAVCVYLRHVCA